MNGVFASGCLAGRRVLVTGASSGLGRAAAVALGEAGAELVLLARDAARLDETARSLPPGTVHSVVQAELVDADDTADLMKWVAGDKGPLFGVFHAAGSYLTQPARLTKQKHLDALFGAAVWGAYGIARAAASKGVMDDGGSLVFISSVAAGRANPGTIGYAGAKAALLGLVPVLALELATRGIRVNAISAAATETEMHLRTIASVSEQVASESRARHMLGFGQPADVAAAVVYLMSDATRWVTGSTLRVDGGYWAK